MSFGVYVHVPFCAHRCDYCDFATWTDRDHLIDDYVDACATDLERRQAESGRTATSVFFGGGTPSLLPAEHLARLLGGIERGAGRRSHRRVQSGQRRRGQARDVRAAGVNRLSFGVQSMVPHVLRRLGRTHDPANVERAIRLAATPGSRASTSI